MTIYQEDFKPTYLYIKQHSVTGKLYFGKTVRNPEKYSGSGTHWKNHIKKYGKEHVVTLWYCLFLYQSDISEFAIMFSKLQDIVESDSWANLKVEDGLDSGTPGHSESTKLILSKNHADVSGENNPMYGKTGVNNPNFGKRRVGTKMKASWSSDDNRKKEMSDRFLNKKLSVEHKEKIRLAKLSIPKVYCDICDRYISEPFLNSHLNGSSHNKKVVENGR